MNACRFYDASDNTWDGFADGTTWNGFDNVWVTRETLEAISAKWEEESLACNCEDSAEQARDLLTMEPCENGLFALAYGYAMQIEEGDE